MTTTSTTAEPSIDELRDQLALLTSYSNDTIYRLRYDTMTYDYISPSVERLLGYTQEEIRAMNIRALILETRIVSNALKTLESFEALENERKEGAVNKWQADYLMLTKDGRKIWVSDISYPWINERGAIVGSVGSLRDITERVEAETRAKEEIARMASTDGLTGLLARPLFFQRLEDELKRIRRSRESLSLLLVDMDYFKNINNNYGQFTGDLILKAVARIINQSMRQTDTAGRVDGGQFGVILPDTPASGAYWVAERIRASVAKETFRLDEENELFGITVSIGVASVAHDQPMEAGAMFKTAEQRLFIAKQTGRNQVSLDELAETL